MKKVLFAAFAGMCVISSIMATSANTGKISNLRISQVLCDTVPPKDTSKIAEVFVMSDTIPKKKSDTTHKPSDTTSMPRIVDLSVK